MLALTLGALACQNRDLARDPPAHTHVFVTELALGSTEALDLLLVLDDSPGMADKHRFLARALPELFAGLVGPTCFDEATGVFLPAPNGDCPDGEGSPRSGFRDLHVGVITSSLGGHGGIACSPAEGSTFVPEQDTRGELVAPLRGIRTPDDLGFFTWDGDGDPAELAAEVAELVLALGETGCGYEAPLEAFYRFLVDPMPPLQVLNDGAASYVDGINETLLEQRARFLRPDSAVAILVISDENDCSVRDDGPGFYVAGATAGGKVPRGTQICATDPNDECCRSCALSEESPPDGCTALSADPGCELGVLGPAEEHPNLRCYEQQRRFGIDLLYPTARYVDALTSSQVFGRACEADADCPPSPQQPEGGECVDVGGGDRYCRYTNPLRSENPYYPDRFPRSSSELVYLTSIVGVPWQDLATAETLTDPDELALVPAIKWETSGESLASRWPILLGDPEAGSYPLDPFMWESITPRLPGTVHALSGLPFPAANPITGDSPLDPSSAGAASPINGHEYSVTDGGDLQYACTFRLEASRQCTDTVPGKCECREADPNLPTKPLCQDAGQTGTGITQHYAMAYPGLRFLSVLEDLGPNAGLGSVCPKLTSDDDATETAYGYRAALATGLLRPLLEGRVGGLRCLSRRLSSSEFDYAALDGDAEPNRGLCFLEATWPEAGVSCRTPGRAPPRADLADAAREELARAGRCGAPNRPSCRDFRICRLTPAEGPNLDLCLGIPDDEVPPGTVGYCYVDAMQDRDEDGSPDCTSELGRSEAWRDEPDCVGNPALVEHCPAAQRRTLRFLSAGLEVPVPHPEATLFVVPLY